jgi:hypothetical protein
MITSIPEGQICQSFDPRMNKTEEVLRNHNTREQPNTSCIAPAYVYVEGKHGKKFLCDTHYYYEIYLNRVTYAAPNHSWKEIGQYIVDERERVKETFAKNVTTTETIGHKCSLVNLYNAGNIGCTADALVKVNATERVVGKINFNSRSNPNNFKEDIFYCNFHYRRTYYRFVSNGIVFEDFHKIVDERSRMTMTIAEEADRLTYI